MKFLRQFIMVIGLLAVASAGFITLTGADFSSTKTVATIPSRVNQVKREIANLSRNHNDLVTHYNALRATFAYGTVPLPLFGWREVDASGDVGDATADSWAGWLGGNTTPYIDASTDTSGDTGDDQSQRITWAASNSDKIAFQTNIPHDASTGADIIFQSRVMADATGDELHFTIGVFFNEGDTRIDASADALTGAPDIYRAYDVTIPAASIPSDAETITIILTPSAHTTSVFSMSSARLKYSRGL